MQPKPTTYARRRMAQRRITEDEIAEVLAAPETSYESASDPGRAVVLGRTSQGRRLKVVVDAADMVTVITVADRDDSV